MALCFALVLGASGCDRAPAVSSGDSVRTVTTPDTARSPSEAIVASGWDADAGLFIVLPTVEGGMVSGSLIRPEATDQTVGDMAGIQRIIGDGQVELFARSGKVGDARMVVEAASILEPGCTAWPVARLATDAQQPMAQWTAAFTKGRVSAIPLDSIEGFSPRDSARMAIDLIRLASGLRDDTVATFRGLPFVVLGAWRSRGLETDFVVATLARRVNQEDSPKEERLVMVVDQSDPDARKWVVGWHERASGREDELVVAEPLLAFQPVPRQGSRETPSKGTASLSAVHLLFGRDDGVALGAATLVRDASGWHVQWESAIAGCS